MSVERPERLYHGSPVQGLAEIAPRRDSVRHPDEGPAVFASPSPAIATLFAVRAPGELGAFNDHPYILLHERDRDRVAGAAGSVYAVPSGTFICNPALGMGPLEWRSEVAVRPLAEVPCASVLEAMIAAGARVYFVDDETMRRIRESADHGYEILRRLQSENERRGHALPPL